MDSQNLSDSEKSQNFDIKNSHLRVILLYEFKLGHSSRQAFININSAYGPNTVHECTVQKWFGKFKNGDTSLNIMPRGHRRASLLIEEQIREAFEIDPEQNCKALAKKLGVSNSTVYQKVKNLKKKIKRDKFLKKEKKIVKNVRKPLKEPSPSIEDCEIELI